MTRSLSLSPSMSAYLPLYLLPPSNVIKCFSARSCLQIFFSFSAFSSFSLLENKLQDERAIKVQLNTIAKARNTHKHAHTLSISFLPLSSLSFSLPSLFACLFRFQMMINGCPIRLPAADDFPRLI